MIANKCEHFVGCLTRDGRHRVMAAYSTDGVKVYAVLAHIDHEEDCCRSLMYNNGDKHYSVGESEYDIMLPTTVVEDGEYPRVDDDDSWDDTWVVLRTFQGSYKYKELVYAIVMTEERAHDLANAHGGRAVRITLHD